MPIPDFIAELRRAVGHAPLWLSGISAVTIRDGKVLLVKRSDNGAWTAVTGILDPGENPADGAVREVLEETGVTVRPTRLAWVHVTGPRMYPNGDQAQYLDHVFRMEWLAGDPYPADDESTEAAWFDLDELPPMTADMRRRIALSATDEVRTVFETSGELPVDPPG
ncbi:ADP-ribose pyrophosphatase YjhB, NUDIX family [Mycobacterium rhizamassiliense]|uniref:ADP-ribose pyrophosphatase YjhB, NUDIX family n=1 Tax=Mycobacterium rhizamassiliense TaxID=1841860 RepID=A0A2U3NNF7_9MYCO|nr:NUDIX domain-containing protein [Mycobacterium rhizamassiliense]SPM33042.1 ADP-ribose pyrophosphatase YjhB, NUDIX family [Mycobacterium rhizamassiliense]